MTYDLDLTESQASRMSQANLADALGEFKAAREEIERVERLCKDELLKRNVDCAIGDKFRAEVNVCEQNRLDTAAVKKEMGEDWYKDHCVPSTVVRVLVKAVSALGKKKAA